jgi:hypothetical protein
MKRMIICRERKIILSDTCDLNTLFGGRLKKSHFPVQRNEREEMNHLQESIASSRPSMTMLFIKTALLSTFQHLFFHFEL